MARRSRSASGRHKRSLPVNSRPIWRGHLKLSLVSCPIAIFNAITEREDIHLHFLNPETGNRIRYQAVDAETGDELERSDLVRGYEFQKDRYVTLTNEEIDELKIESSSVMDVEEFIPFEAISPLYFEGGYYILPDGEAGMDAYAVIRAAMEKAGAFAIARATIARKERVIALKPGGKGIIGHALREESDIRPMEDFFGDIPSAKIDRDALDIATKLVERKTGEFKPGNFEDRFEKRLRALIDAKLEGVELEPEEIEAPPNVVNLMDALKRSLKDGSGRSEKSAEKPKAKGGATVHRLPARKNAKKATSRKPARRKRG